PPYSFFKLAREDSKRKHCRTAKNHLIDGLEKVDEDSKEHFKAAENVSVDVESCFRSRSSKSRSWFWLQMEEALGKGFGFRSIELSKRKLELVYWKNDEFVKAREIFNANLKKAREDKLDDIAAETLYTLARIEE